MTAKTFKYNYSFISNMNDNLTNLEVGNYMNHNLTNLEVGNYMNHNLTNEQKVAAIRDFNRRQGLPIENPNKVLFNGAIFEESQLDFKPRQGYIYEPIAADSDIE